jgi:hypothetical protein
MSQPVIRDPKTGKNHTVSKEVQTALKNVYEQSMNNIQKEMSSITGLLSQKTFVAETKDMKIAIVIKQDNTIDMDKFALTLENDLKDPVMKDFAERVIFQLLTNINSGYSERTQNAEVILKQKADLLRNAKAA